MTKPKQLFDDAVTPLQSQQTSEHVYFDGVAGMRVGAANCKVDFFQDVLVKGTDREQRNVQLTAVIPTAAMVTFCINFLNSVEANKETLEKALSEQRDKTFAQLSQTLDSKRVKK